MLIAREPKIKGKLVDMMAAQSTHSETEIYKLKERNAKLIKEQIQRIVDIGKLKWQLAWEAHFLPNGWIDLIIVVMKVHYMVLPTFKLQPLKHKIYSCIFWK